MKLPLEDTKQLEGNVRTLIFNAPGLAGWTLGQYLHLTLKHNNPDCHGRREEGIKTDYFPGYEAF